LGQIIFGGALKQFELALELQMVADYGSRLVIEADCMEDQ
jgi:hypothetical protein